MPRTRYMSNHLDQYLARLDAYFGQREAQGLGVPESAKKKGSFSITTIANETCIPRFTLEGSPPLRECIIAWSKKIGFSPADNRGKGAGGGSIRKREYEKKIDDYISRLKHEGKKIPQNPGRIGTPNWERISSETGIPVTSFRKDSAAGKLMRRVIEEIGLDIYQESEYGSLITYRELLETGGIWREEELIGKSHARQRLYNTRTHLRFFMLHAGEIIKQKGFEEKEVIGTELLERFEEMLRLLTSQIESADTRSTFSSQIRRWQSYYLRICRSKELPKQFIAALEAALNRALMNTAQLSEAANVSLLKINAWLNGINNPAIESFPEIRRIEQALSLSLDTLTSRIIKTRPKHFSSSVYPEYVIVDNEEVKIRKDKKILSYLRPLLPDDYDTITADERLEITVWLVKNLIRPTTEWGRWHRSISGTHYSLREFPPVVAEEFNELVKFKREKIPPPDMKRVGSWSHETEVLHKNTFQQFFGYLSLPADAEDRRFRGLGLDPYVFTLAILSCHKFIDKWLRWKARRRKNGCEEDSYSFFDICILESIINHLEPETGWLRQKPEIAKYLKPISGFIDESFIKRARSDWNGTCDEALIKYKELAAVIEDVAEEQRDPFEPIMPLLDVDHLHYQNPILALRTFSQNIINDLPDPSLAPIKAARQVRNYLITRILFATVFRSRNIRELTYREDNTGQLRRRGDKWVVVISWKLFKNKQSSFFGSKKKKHDYERVLADKDGLYMWIEEYIRKHRPILLKGVSSDTFFVGTLKNPIMPIAHFHRTYRRLTIYYFAYNPYLNRGVPGVKPHGPHSVRDILATFVIQLTGSFELAAYVIGDAERTVREHYTRFMPKDKTRLVDFLINAAWDGELKEDSSMPSFLKQILLAHLGIV